MLARTEHAVTGKLATGAPYQKGMQSADSLFPVSPATVRFAEGDQFPRPNAVGKYWIGDWLW